MNEDEKGHQLQRLVTNLFRKWELTDEEASALLRTGSSHKTNRLAVRRLEMLVSIHLNLCILFPHNPEVLYTWVKRRNGLINNQTPLSIMMRDDIDGIRKILAFTEDLLLQ